MRLSSNSDVSSIKLLKFAMVFWVLTFLSIQKVTAHGTQVEYCFTNNGMVRIYIEHWHGNVTNFSQSIVNMTITVNGVATTMNVPASGFVHDTAQADLPDCSAPTVQISECTNRSDIYNDWAYFDFPAPECYNSLVIRINSVTDPTFVLLECGAGNGGPIYPAQTPVLNREDEFPPYIECVTELPNIILNCGDLIPPPQDITTIQVTDDCTDQSDLVLTVDDVITSTSCTGPMITRTYTFTDDFDRETDCLQFISYVPDDEEPMVRCPSDLTIGCDDPSAQNLIDAWLASYSVRDNCSADVTVVNSYTESGFSYVPLDNEVGGQSTFNLGMSSWPMVNQAINKSFFKELKSSTFFIKETTNNNQYDKVIKTRLRYLPGMSEDFSDVLIVDSDERLLPMEIEDLVPGVSAQLQFRIPELKAGQNNRFQLLYGTSHLYDLSFDSNRETIENSGFLIISDFLSNSIDRTKKATESTSPASEVMGCNCTASQGAQSFPINAIQNPRDDVEFYIFGNSGTSQNASSNTTFECNDQAVIFLYENTLTGEISLFIILDAAGGGNGGSGSLDFYCLPATATLDYSDDRGEITGIFPTVTAFWRWANCCTDGAVIGNVGCDQTFDIYPDFISGINSIKWVSGTPTSPIYNTFNNITDPIRISCGDSNPSCCPNTNQVDITNATCPSDSDGSIDITPDVTGGPYDFVWSTGDTTEDISGLEPGDYTVTIVDDNDCEQISTFTVEVETKPQLTCAADQTVLMSGTSITLEEGINVMYSLDYDCPDDHKINCAGCGTFNCSDQNTVKVVTLTVSDELSNTDECTINVTIQNLAPELTCPEDLTVGCVDPNGDSVIETWLTTVVSVDPERGASSINDNYDEANFAFRSQEDTPQKVSGKQSFSGGPQGQYLNLFETLRFTSPPPSSGSQVVTFTATDDCGNTSTCTASIIIVDNTDPVITCPSDITIECGDPNNDAILTNWMDNATATDVCDDNLTITNNFTALSAQECGGVTTVTFTARDTEGNAATCRSTLTHEDSTPPEFLMKPQDITVECINSNGGQPAINAWTAANGNGMARDDCDPTLRWSFTLDSQEELCGYTYLRTYTFTVQDDCGNSSTSVATALVEDTTPPVINLVWDELIQTCTANNETNLASYLEQNRRATDVCSAVEDVTIEWVLFNDVSSCGGTIDRTYLYTATDACGNTSTDYFHYMTTDAVVPTWANVPGTLVVECGDEDNPLIITQWMQDVQESMFDACGGELSISNNFTGDLTELCNRNTVVTWTVTDECGNSRELNRTIAVRDRINPEIINCPEDFTVNVDVANCSSNVIFSTPIGYDQCTDVVTINQNLGPASGSAFPVGTTRIIFEAVDDCGRRSNPDCDFNITVIDSDVPSLACPSNDVVVCADEGTCTWIGDDSLSPVAMENCATANITYTVTGATMSSGNNTAVGLTYQFGTSTVCYTVTDASANTSSCCFEVVVTDCEAPTTSCPEDLTVACDGIGNSASLAAWLASATATDNCSSSLVLINQAFNTISSCGNTNTTVYQFTVTDLAGNEAQCLASFTIEDMTDPVITTPASPGDSDCENANADLLDWLNNFGYAEATDDCGAVNWSHDFNGGAMTGCSGVTSLMVTFTATDECGNTATTQANFNVDDTEPPVISCPFDITLECGDVLNDAVIELWLESVTAVDNCTTPEFRNDYPRNYLTDCGSAGVYTVAFQTRDECGNDSDCNATISIEDTTPPVFILQPQDLVVECGPEAIDPEEWIRNNGGAEASDQCDDNLTWDVKEDGVSSGCGDSRIIDYVFIVTDDCGNSASATAQYIFEDTASPTVRPPSDITVECGAAATSLADWQARARASDDCGDGFTFEAILFNTISGCGDSKVEVYQFTATDACGNEGTALASYTIEDTTLPSITCPAPLVLECGDDNNNQLINDWLESATGNDTCGDLSFSEDFNGTLPSNCGGVVAVTFVVSDLCDNTSSCVVNMTMDDTGLPDFDNCPSDLTVNVDVDLCGSNPIFSTPFALDNCDVTVVQTGGISSGNTFPVGTTAIEFTATDDCGNTDLCQFDITVEDTDVPLILCPGGSDNVCVDDGACFWTSENIAPILGQENCDDYDITYTITNATNGSGVDDASGTIFNPGMSVTCYTITDDSGNSSSCCFHVYVADCEAPVVTCPTPETVECAGDGNTDELETWLDSVSAVDNCDDSQTFSSEVYNTISDCGGANSVTYRFAATDNSDNTSFCLSTFTIEDTTAPVIDSPAENLTVECAGGSTNTAELAAWLNNNGGAEALDLCSELTWAHDFSTALSNLCGETGANTITFTVTDACGNTATSSADFTIEDTTAPVITCPLPIVLECNDPLNDAVITTWLSTSIATDLCSEVIITHTYPNVKTSACGDTGAYDITFTATDDCSNTSSCNSTITIEDSIAPIFELNPSDLVLECADINNAALITDWLANDGSGIANDQCSNVVWSQQELDAIGSCGLTDRTPYIFTVTDACGNTSTRTAWVITENTTDPVLFMPADMVVECDGTGNVVDLNDWLEDVTGSSDCGAVTTDYELYNTISACGGGSEQVFLFRATDDCGNQSTGLASFTIEDSSMPTAVCPPTLILECGLEGNDQAIAAWLLSANVSDATGCSGFSLTNNFNGTLPGFICDGDSGSVVQFTATDDCGNTGVCQSLITLNDTQDPYFVNCPTDMIVNVDTDLCATNVVYSQPVALDVCDTAVDVVLSSGIASGATFPTGTTTILYTATDNCGNTRSCTFDITVEDSALPTIACPSNKVTVCTDEASCAWEATDEVSAVFSDNCPAAGYTVTYDIKGVTIATSTATGINDIDDDNIIFELGSSEVCYAIEDAAGNGAFCCFEVVVEDCENPDLTCPVDIIVECDGADNESDLMTWLATVASVDNCLAVPLVSNQQFNSISACGETNTRVFEFSSEDDHGNVTTCYSEFTVVDTSAPDINIPASDLTVECSGTVNSASLTAWLNDVGGAEASDLCNEVEWTHDFTTPLANTCEGGSMTTVIFTATDECGNTSTTSADFIIEDTTAPVLECPSDITVECAASINAAVIENWLNGANGYDTCSEVMVTNDYGAAFADDCGETGVHTVIFTATDNCGNTTTCTQTVTIEDTTPPSIESVAQNLLLECSDARNPALISAWEMNNGNAVATDACSDEVLDWSILSQVPASTCGSATTTTYIFQVSDNCGNTSTIQASVIIEDTTAPVLIVPEDQVEECSAIIVDLNTWLNEVIASDDCAALTVTNELWNTTSGCGGTELLTYLFTATDECGNITTGLADYIIEDTSAPAPICPANLTLMCGDENNDQIILAWLNSATSTDANSCSATEITSDYPGRLPLLSCDGSGGLPIVFAATDACGNVSSCISTIFMNDTALPYFSNCPLDMVVNVDADLCETNVIYSQPIALDNCDENVGVALTSGIASGNAFPIGTTTLIYMATDDCGNTNTCQFDITVADSDIPAISCPSNAVYVCTDAASCTWEATEVSSAIFADNCADEGYIVTYIVTGATTVSSMLTGVNDVDTDNVVFNLGASEVCYLITDDAGNTAQCCFNVVVEDCEDPTIVCPSDMTVECDGAGNDTQLMTWLGSISGTDNCDLALGFTNLVFNTISGCGNTDTEVYQFTVEDDNGNTASCLASFIINDTTAPVLVDSGPFATTVQCDGESNIPDLIGWLQNNAGLTTVTEACSPYEWMNDYEAGSDELALCNTFDHFFRVDVNFWVVDECGNESNKVEKRFRIEDLEPPVLTCPNSITLECDYALNDVIVDQWLSSATSSDACHGPLEVINDYSDQFAEACGLSGVYTVTFTATDPCGNASTCAPTIAIEDTTAPTIESPAEDLYLECAATTNTEAITAWEMNFGGAAAIDACSDEALIWTILETLSLGGCGDTGWTRYTFQVTDNCGNTSTTQASVIIEDTKVPVLTVPEDQIEECGAIVVDVATWLAEVSGTDECGTVTFSSVLWNTVSGCGGTDTETYLFTATDACGNETTGFADYIIEDTSDPAITCPANLALVCGNESNDQMIINWLSTATTTDSNDCSAVEITNDFPTSLPDLICNMSTGIEIVFTATDACENTSTCSSIITMDDTTAPYFSNCPLDMVVNVDVDLCETNVVYSQPVALDDCDENVAVALTSGIPSGSAFPVGTTTLLFTATDDCGNTSTCEFDITVVDSDIPSIACPSNDVYVCIDEASCTWEATEVSSAIFADNCADEGYTVSYTVTGATTANSPATGINDVDEDDLVFNLGSSEVCYTITDEADNSAQCCFDIVVEDCEAPTLTCNDVLNVACGSEDLAAWYDGIASTMMDNCNANAELVLDTLLLTDFSSCGSTIERVYMFVVTDEAGNTSSCLATYETDDTLPPVVTDAENLTIECTDGSQSTALLAWLQNNGGASFTSDNCSTEVTWTNDYRADLVTSCGSNGATLVTFTATDDCGNSTTTQATFTIEDNIPPVLSCPENITVECSNTINTIIIQNWIGRARSEDACQGSLDILDNYEEVFVGACGQTGVHTVTFTSTDACDNVSTCDRTITIVDTTDPVIDVLPQDLILECAAATNATAITDWESSFGGAAATDACSDEALVWTITSQVNIGDCGTTSSTLYTFRVTDNCGNTATTQASVIIEDTTVPLLTVPEDQVEECGAIVVDVATWLAEVSGTDECGNVTFSSVLWNTVSGCGGTETETYLFTATDACGNETTGFASYILQDTSKPTIVCPDNLSLVCGNEANDQIIINWLSTATATDEYGCSALEITNDYPADFPVLDCNDGAGINISFTVADACDNSDNCSATITMDDAEAPYFSNCPIDMTVNVDVDRCESNVVYSQPIALDNCDENVDVALVEGIPSGNPFPLDVTTLTFEAVDGCGNTSTCTFDITVVDSDVPSVSCPSNDVVVCTDAATCTWLSTDQTDPIYNDNCPGQVLTYSLTGETTANSALAGENKIATDGVVFELGESEVVYTITDPTGNMASCSFTVLVEDCEDPMITCNNQLAIACGAEDVSSWFADIAGTVSDNCDGIGTLTVDTLLLTDFSSCGSTFNRVYRYVVTDAEGNSSSCLATYQTEDTVAPTIDTEAENLTLECKDANQSTALLAWLNNIAGATASDVCSGPVTWTNDFVGDLVGSCGANGEVLVTFTATDDCGNTSTTSATFRIEDNTPPVLSCPDNLVLECADRLNDAVISNWLRTATANDECEGKTFVTHNYPDVYVDACGETGEYTVTFTTVDVCGNSTSCDRTITFVDTTDPEIFLAAENLELSCGSTTISADIAAWLADNGGAEATDVCSDENLVWTNEILETADGCGGYATTTYVFTVTDNCGNTTTSSATVVVIDDTNPEFDAGPFDQVIECYPTGNEVALINWLNNNGGAVVSDDCTTDFEWEYDLINVIDNCGNTITRVYRFTVTDDCGNTSTAEANFEIHDTTNPDITKEAEPFTTQCNGSSNSAEILSWLNNNGYAEANDRCGNITWSNNYGSIVADCGATGGVEVVFTATDECGNTSTTVADFIINDEVDPYWILQPQNLEVECDGSADPMGQIESWLNLAGGGEAADDCSAISYSNNFSIVNLECDMQGGVEVIFTVTDACGNLSTAAAMLIITDDVPPIITVEATNQTVECDGAGNIAELEAWLEAHGDAEAADACSASLVWNYELRSTVGSCGVTSNAIYDFTATDACGNVSVITMAAFIIEDTTVPVFDLLPQNQTVECDGAGNDEELQTWLDLHGGAVASDICSMPITWSYDLVMDEDSCGITGIQVYRFTITDDCGNNYSEEATFIIEDTTSPDLIAGEDMTMEECDDNITGNILDFDFWLVSNAGATATDACGEMTWSNNYDPENWQTTCGNTRFVDVVFTVTDACGNTSDTEHRFGVGDVTAPEFINCPRPPVINDAPDGWCSAYANYATPIAEDNCSDLTVTQVDDSGLQSGDLFPVGLTIITFVAEDECGNSSTCELKIIVNDFHTPPTIVCPESVQVENDPSICGALVPNLAPINVEDNCIENTTVTYELLNEQGVTISCGFENASKELFPVGTTTVQYKAVDQPLLLITEIIQDGNTTGVELTNFGPAHLDITCLEITREGPDNETHNVPNGTILNVGETYAQLFSDIDSGIPAGYYISFVETIMDGVALNGHTPSAFGFSGAVYGDNISRTLTCDHDNADDFLVTTSCFVGSFGSLNPSLTTMTANGTTVALQEAVPSVAECSFEVVVIDTEPAFCAEYDTTRVCIVDPQTIAGNSCTAIEFAIPAGITVGDVNLTNLGISITDASQLDFELTSPSGTRVFLFGGLCNGEPDISVSLDDTADEVLADITCGPLGQEAAYQPIGNFLDYFDESAGGVWTLHIANKGAQPGVLNNVCIEVLELVPYSQADVALENDLGQCGAVYTWQIPQLSDNCGAGMMTVTYESDDQIPIPPSGDVAPGLFVTELFEVGTTRVIYTIVDEYGNKSVCGFEVVVEDSEMPALDASQCIDQTIQLAANQCFVPASALNFPALLDNCGSSNISFTPSVSQGLPAGDHPLVLGITDAFGNNSNCNFMVTVLPFMPSSDQMLCLGQINLSLDADCEEEITAAMLLAPGGQHGCTTNYCIEVTDAAGNEVLNNVATEEHIGQTLTVKVCTDCNGGNCCWGEVLIENKLIPSIDCPEQKVTIVCNEIFEPSVVGEPILETCEQEVYFSYEDNITFGDMCDDFPGSIERIWTITDESNNTIECLQEIIIERFDINAVNFPADTIITTAEINCVDVAEDPTLIHPDHTGYPDLNGVPISETGDGLCSHFWNWDDQILFNCEGSYEILRKWLVRDMCEDIVWGTNPIEYYQSIKVIDNMAPVFEGCQDELIFASADFDCSTDVYLNDYMPDIIELCGSIKDTVFSVSPGTVMERPAGSGEYYLTNMAPGMHTVKITVRDQCSNFSRCTFDIEVEDKTGPQVICEQDLHISLNSSGIAEVPAEVLDDGSYDNCTAIKHQIFRMTDGCDNPADLEPGDYVTLCCNDVSTEPIQLMMRVWDDADTDGIFGTMGDHYSECMVRVVVSDSNIPELTCPADVIIACDQDYNNINLTGQPSIGSACSFADASFEDDIAALTECTTGAVIRTWNIEGYDIACKQTINITAAVPFTGNDIVWPEDFEGDCSEMNDAVEPMVSTFDCTQIGIDLESDTFYFSEAACYKVVNTWKVVDWCQYDSAVSPTVGIWTHQQTIKIVSTTEPTITGCGDIEVDIQSPDCSLAELTITNAAEDNSCGQAAILNWTYAIDKDEDGIADVEGTFTGDNPSVTVTEIEGGSLTVVWQVTDGCGNATSCTQRVLPVDKKSPTAYCQSISTVVMDATGEATLWVSDFDAGSFDNCTAIEDLLFSFDSVDLQSNITFSCDDMPNGVSVDIPVMVYVTDEAGNQSNCITQLSLQDPNDACLDNGEMMMVVGGSIQTEDGKAVEDVETYLISTVQAAEAMALTDSMGTFYFDQVSTLKEQVVSPFKNNDHINGISTFDLILMQRHILGERPLSSPYKIIAADVTGDARVNGQDMVQLRKLILGQIDTFHNNYSWTFVDKAFEFEDPKNPFPYQETIAVSTTDSVSMANEFIGVKIGDVDNSVELLKGKEKLELRAVSKLYYGMSAASQENQYLVPVFSNDSGLIYGFQFGLKVNYGTIIDVLPGSVDLTAAHMNLYSSTELSISWNGIEGAVSDVSIPLFYLLVKDAEENLFTLDIITEQLVAETYIGEEMTKRRPVLSRYNKEVETPFVLYQNEPNPFKETTDIKFFIPEDQEVNLSFYGMNGQLIYSIIAELEEGLHSYTLSADQFDGASVIYYKLSSDLYNESKKMILVK